MSASDRELLVDAAAGNPRAGQDLFASCFPILYRFFCNKVSQGIEDLIQQTFVAALESAPSYRGDASLHGFVCGIARNILYGHYREKRRAPAAFDPDHATVEDLAPGAVAVLARAQEQRLLLEALRHLPIDMQLTLELSFWEGMSGAEIAEVLDVSPHTVRSRLARAKARLEFVMEDLADSPATFRSTLSGLESWATQLREGLAQHVKV